MESKFTFFLYYYTYVILGDNIKMDPQEVGCRSMDWIELAQDKDRWLALVGAVMNLWVP